MKSRRDILRGAKCCTMEKCPEKMCPYYRGHDGVSCLHALSDDLDALLDSMHGTITESEPEDKPPKDDPVNHPSHYTQGGVECIDAIKAATTGLVGFEGYCTGNIIKYLWRWKQKNGTEDLRKAVWYIDRLIGETEG